jgi:general stress protein CsbA
VLLGYVVLMLLTRTLDQGDTSVYGNDLVNWLRGRQATMWEFGHAIWRPLAAAVLSVVHADPARVTDGVLFEQAVRVLTWLSMLGGALAVVLFRAWLVRVGVSRWVAVATAIAFTAASAFLGYAQTGSSYVPGVAMLLLGLWALAGDERTSDRRTIAVASVELRARGAVLVPARARGAGERAVRDHPARRQPASSGASPFAVCVVSGLITILVYLPIAALWGVRSVDSFRAWMVDSQHGIRDIGGVPRTVVGFGRSLVNMDRLGLVAKRYLIHDAYNPTTVADVARAGLFRLAALYAVLAVMAVALAVRPAGRRALALLVLTAIPVVGFALKWQGGDLERYLAMFPALFLAIGVSASLLARRATPIAAAIAVLSSR